MEQRVILNIDKRLHIRCRYDKIVQGYQILKIPNIATCRYLEDYTKTWSCIGNFQSQALVPLRNFKRFLE